MPQKWCPNCKRNVEVEQKERKISKKTKLVEVTTVCSICNRTLNKKMVLPSKEEDEESE